MGSRVYVSNLPWTTNEDDLHAFFTGFVVSDVKIITDRETGRPRGFAFIGLSSPEHAKQAIATLNGKLFGGRTIKVCEARERTKQENATYADVWKK